MDKKLQELKKKVFIWKCKILSGKCSCLETCCDPRKLMIQIDDFSLPLFKEKGIPYIQTPFNKGEINESWSDNLKFFSSIDSEQVKKPAIIFLEGEKILYADKCPFLNNKNGCDCYQDKRRPSSCNVYPIHLLYNPVKLIVRGGCSAITKKVIRDLKADFGGIEINIIP